MAVTAAVGAHPTGMNSCVVCFQIKPCLQQAFYFYSHIFLFRRVAEKRKVVTRSATEYFYCNEVLDVSQKFGSADFGDKCLVKVSESHC